MKYVTASRHGKTYYLPQDSVLQIEHKATVSKVPFSPEWVVGIISYLGEPVPVIDAFATDATPSTLQILCGMGDCVAAYQADAIGDFLDMDEAETQPFAARASRYLTNIRVPKTEM